MVVNNNVLCIVFMCHTLRFCAISSVILYYLMSSRLLSSHFFLGFLLHLLPCTCMFLGGILPFRPYHVAAPSESSLPEEGCHCFDVGLSPDVFILDVVLLGHACIPSQHSHLSGIQLLCIFFTVSNSIKLM